MTISANGNIYEASLNQVRQLFQPYLQGNEQGLFCVVSHDFLDQAACKALESSAEALGYGPKACTFIALAAEQPALDSQALFLLLEGLDPLYLVAADQAACSALKDAYRCAVPANAATRLFGRDAATFKDFSAMLQDVEEKQRAWALLKQLPQRA